MFLLFLACQNNKDSFLADYSFLSEELDAFSLIDVNTSSVYFDQEVASDAFPEMVSAWYFGQST